MYRRFDLRDEVPRKPLLMTSLRDEAISIYRESYAWLSDNPTIAPRTVAAIAYNAGRLIAFRGDESEAEGWLIRARDMATTHRLEDLAPLVSVMSGFVWAVLGREEMAKEATLEGLAFCLRRSRWYEFASSLDHTAGTLAVLGHGSFATGLLECGGKLRKRRKTLRSPGDHLFVDRVRRMADADPDAEWANLRRSGEILKAVERLIG